MDKCALLFQYLSRLTLSSPRLGEAKGIKDIKERLSIVLCCNADGSIKIRLTVIGHHENPRCFKHGRPSGINDFSNENAWMTEKNFTSWLRLH
jgi:hypothetical protein